MTRTILAVLVVLAAGCGRGNDWPDVEHMYSVSADAVICTGTTGEDGTPEGGPYTLYRCVWTRANFGGVPHCYVVATFQRADASSPWSLVDVYGSASNCGG